MKTKLYLAALCMAATLAAGCSSNEEPAPQPQPVPQVYEDLMACYAYNDNVTLSNGKKPSQLEWMKDYVYELLDREQLSTWMTFAMAVKCPDRDLILTREEISSPYISSIFDCEGNRLQQSDLTEEEAALTSADNAEGRVMIMWMNTDKLYAGDILDRLNEYQKENR